MRNLKKILALVLALIMSLSLMATAGAGSFQDVTDDNPYKTAIDVLDELKVFQGFEDGTFKPTDTLTRAQAAVLVYRIATGDVDNKYLDNYTYMQQSKFTDLDGYNWAKGYINYCQNAGIVVGTDATHFNPGGQVTGYQLLVMLLRTLGYGKAGEFTDPKGWELQTASIAEREGILKNVTGGDFEHAAPRQMVAEILFRGILHDTVEYSPLTPGGYTNSGVALGKKTLGLEDIEGVVVANRIADLYDTEPMKDGQTRMIVDGKDYVIDMDTDATAIGLNHHAYVKDGKVLGGTLEAAGNVIGEPEHGEAAKVADLAKAAGIKVTRETEHYVNFDQFINGYSKWRLEYSVQFDDITDQAKFESRIGLDLDDVIVDGAHDGLDKVVKQGEDGAKYTRAIPRNRTITPQDITIMEGIFTYASGDTDATDFDVKGSVYAGTNNSSDTNVNRNKDLAAVMTWDDFYDEYILGSKTEVTASDNGEWLRVIDNDGDGEVDYVLRTDFIMTTVLDYEKRTDLYNVEYDVDGNGTTGNNIISKIPAGEIRKDDNVDMSVGAVILYTYIDGWYYISNPEVQVLTVEKKSIDQKKNTFTADGEAYTWSGIDEEAAKYYDDVSEISYDVNYAMYFDHFGFVRLATEARRNFVLLTDAYFKTDLRDHEWKVDLYDGTEKVEATEVVDAARENDDRATRGIGYDGEIDGFIDTVEEDHQGNRGTWKRLNTFGEFYQQTHDTDYTHYVDKNTKDEDLGTNETRDPFYTNVALGSETDGTWTLQDVTDIDSIYNSLRRAYNVYELAGSNGTYNDGNSRIKKGSLKASNTDLWGVKGNNLLEADGWDQNTVDSLRPVQTNYLTLYYVVENADSDSLRKVTSWVGYNGNKDYEKFVPDYAYVVAHDSGDGYDVADVVVLEKATGKATTPPQLITTGINPKWLNALGKNTHDDETPYEEHRENWNLFTDSQLQYVAGDGTKDAQGVWTPQLNFFVDEGSGPKMIPDESSKHTYEDYGIYAGIVTVVRETKTEGDYIEITPDGDPNNDDRIKFTTDDVAVYELDLQVKNHKGEAAHNINAYENNENILKDDKVIVVKDGDNVAMVINVSASGVDGEPWADRRTGEENDANMIVKLAQEDTGLFDVINDEWANPDTTYAKITTVKVQLEDESEVTGSGIVIAADDKVIDSSDAEKFPLVIGTDPAYTIKDIVATNATAAQDGDNHWYLFNIKEGKNVELTITVEEVKVAVTITGNTGLTAGSVAKVEANGEEIANGAQVLKGTELTITATPAATKKLSVTVDGDSVTLDENDQYKVSADADIAIVFTEASLSSNTALTSIKIKGVNALNSGAPNATSLTKAEAESDALVWDIEVDGGKGEVLRVLWDGNAIAADATDPVTTGSLIVVVKAEDGTEHTYPAVTITAATSASTNKVLTAKAGADGITVDEANKKVILNVAEFTSGSEGSALEAVLEASAGATIKVPDYIYAGTKVTVTAEDTTQKQDYTIEFVVTMTITAGAATTIATVTPDGGSAVTGTGNAYDVPVNTDIAVVVTGAGTTSLTATATGETDITGNAATKTVTIPSGDTAKSWTVTLA